MNIDPLPLLLIEDNQGDARLIELFLREVPVEAVGFHLTWVDRLAKGLALLADSDYALVLLDLSLPDSLGLATFKTLHEKFPHIPVIVLTGLNDNTVALEAVGLGAQDYLVKGKFEADLLIRACGYALERSRIQQALRLSETRYALAAQGANDGLWDWDLKTNEIYFSPRWKTILGYQAAELPNRLATWFGRIHPEDLHQVEQRVKRHQAGESAHLESEHRLRHRDGSYRWVLVRGLAVRDAAGQAYRMAGSLTDITDRKRFEEQLLHDAFHDVLTGLPNRALFADRLGQVLERIKRAPIQRFAVLYLDLDRFKLINDTCGHNGGDEVLIAVARRIQGCLRASDTVARLGGDEFAVLLPEVAAIEAATIIATRIQTALKAPYQWQGREVFVSASIGLILAGSSYQSVEAVVRDADIAMYHAKTQGKARYVVFEEAMRSQVEARLELEADLRRAIGHGEFLVHYQPILSLDQERLVGFEALVRWQHPERGLLSAEEFIPIAEETSLVVPIDWWVLREACQQLVVWQRQFPTEPPLTMSVNLSRRHFSEQELVNQVKTILQATGLDPSGLRLEITESAVVENPITATALLLQLQALGVQLQIDDFGTGYSSLSYLHQFPVNAIKIDRSFIQEMGASSKPLGIVQTIVAMARDLDLEVIAEGVETGDQLMQLQDLECKLGQGYHFAKPMDREAMAAFIADYVAPTVAELSTDA